MISERDEKIKRTFKERGIEIRTFNGSLWVEPWEVTTKQGEPYKVFTPFWKACLQQLDPSEPRPAPKTIPTPDSWPNYLRVETLELEPKVDWARGIRDAWSFGEDAAHERLEAFLDEWLSDYSEGRDRPDRDGTSRLSPHLHFGEIGPRQVWHAVQAATSGHKLAWSAPWR